MSDPVSPETSDYDTYLTIAVETSEAVIIGERADRIAWARAAWSGWLAAAAKVTDDGRKLRQVRGVFIERKSPELVHVTLWFLFRKAPDAVDLAEAEAKRQFWTHVEGAWKSCAPLGAMTSPDFGAPVQGLAA